MLAGVHKLYQVLLQQHVDRILRQEAFLISHSRLPSHHCIVRMQTLGHMRSKLLLIVHTSLQQLTRLWKFSWLLAQRTGVQSRHKAVCKLCGSTAPQAPPTCWA